MTAQSMADAVRVFALRYLYPPRRLFIVVLFLFSVLTFPYFAARTLAGTRVSPYLFPAHLRAPLLIDRLLNADASRRMFCGELTAEEVQVINATYGLLSIRVSTGSGNLLYQLGHMLDCGERVLMPSYLSKSMQTSSEAIKWVGDCLFLPPDVDAMRRAAADGSPRERGVHENVLDPMTYWFGSRDCQIPTEGGVIDFPQERLDAEVYRHLLEDVGAADRMRESLRRSVRDELAIGHDDDDDDDNHNNSKNRKGGTGGKHHHHDDDDDDDDDGDGEGGDNGGGGTFGNFLFSSFRPTKKPKSPLGDWFRCHSLVAPDELIVHVRSGDIFRGAPHPPYFQPPMAWYHLIISKHRELYGAKAPVTVLTAPDHANPVVDALRKAYGDGDASGALTVRSNANVSLDICTLVGARSVALASSTFSTGFVSLISTVAEHVYVPLLYYGSYTKRFERERDFLPWFLYGWKPRRRGLHVHRYCFPKYACDGWLDRPDQRRKMIEWNGTLAAVDEGEELSERCDPDDPERVDYARVRHDEKSLRQMKCVW